MSGRVGFFDSNCSHKYDGLDWPSRLLVAALMLVVFGVWPASSVISAEPWSTGATASDVAYTPPAYQDKGVENALDTGDYARAQTLITSKINSLSAGKNSIAEAYLRTTLVEALTWQGQLSAATAELKKLKKVLENLKPDGGQSFSPEDEKELTARALDDESWLLEGLGKLDEALSVIGKAIVMLKELRAVDRQTWRLVGCLSHSAALKAAAGDFEGAKQLLEDALAQAGGSHSISPLNMADIQESLGAVLYRLGSQKEAATHFSLAIDIKNNTGAIARRYAPGPYWLSPNYRFIEGAPWSRKTFQDGVETKVIDLGALKVSAAVVRDKNAAKQAVQVLLTVVNQTNQSVEFMGKRPEFTVITPRVSYAQMIDPGTLAEQIQKKGDGKAKWIRFWGQGATQPITTTYMGNMPFYGYGYGGAYPPVMGYGGAMPIINRSNGMTTMTTNVPDPMAEARAFQKASQVESAARAKADDIRSRSLGPSDIASGQSISGSVYFDAAGLTNGSACLVLVPIGDSQFEFRFDNVVGAP